MGSSRINAIRQRLAEIRLASPDYLYLTRKYPENKEFREEAKEERAYNKSEALEEKYKTRARDPTHRTGVDKSKDIPYGKENRTYEEQAQDAFNKSTVEYDQNIGAKWGLGDFKENIYTDDLNEAELEKQKGIADIVGMNPATKKLEGSTINVEGAGGIGGDIAPWKPVGYKPLKIYPGREEYVGGVKQLIHKPKRREWTRIISAKSARIQMARERLGAVGKIDWSEIISKQIKPDLEIPSIGAGFLSPKGEYFDLMSSDSRNHDRWLQDILKSTGDKSLMEKYDPYFIGKGHNYQSVAPWLKDSGMMRLRHTNQSSVGIESHSTPTSAQISSLKTYIKDYDLDTDNLLVDDYANSNLETELKLTNRFNAKLRQRIEAI